MKNEETKLEGQKAVEGLLERLSSKVVSFQSYDSNENQDPWQGDWADDPDSGVTQWQDDN
ncbi:MAG TPA: hypothetical protein PKA77_03600 [Chitinophagaceae bacterium]|jgi:hypothetical protein|nr:hypothetical protein [Chitinophagaceae bacterium]HMU57460.1 hypothetical protein [Chitinophagaceae bacterium]